MRLVTRAPRYRCHSQRIFPSSAHLNQRPVQTQKFMTGELRCDLMAARCFRDAASLEKTSSHFVYSRAFRINRFVSASLRSIVYSALLFILVPLWQLAERLVLVNTRCRNTRSTTLRLRFPSLATTGTSPMSSLFSQSLYSIHETVRGSAASILAEFANLRVPTMVGTDALLDFEQRFHADGRAGGKRSKPDGGSGMAALFLAQHFDQEVGCAVHDRGDLRKVRHRVHESS